MHRSRLGWKELNQLEKWAYGISSFAFQHVYFNCYKECFLLEEQFIGIL